MGSNLAKELSNHNCDLVLFDKNNKNINSSTKSIKGDIMDFKQVHSAVRSKNSLQFNGEADIDNSINNIQMLLILISMVINILNAY